MKQQNFANSLSFVVILSLLTFGCAPKVEEKKIPTETLVRGPHFHDTNLSKINGNTFADKNYATSKLKISNELLQQTELIESEFFIRDNANSNEWSQMALLAHQNYLKTQSFSPLKIANSVYLDIVDQQINKTVSSSVNSASAQLQNDVGTVTRLVRLLKEKYLILTPESLLDDKLQATKIFINQIMVNISNASIMPEFKNLLSKQLQEKSSSLLTRAYALNDQATNASTVSQLITAIDSYVVDTKTELDAQDQKNIAVGRKLGTMIDAIGDEKMALQTLALVWSVLDAQQRIDFVQTANASLYKFFATKDDGEIQCLISSDCNGLLTNVALTVGVYPAIQFYGIEAIKKTLTEKGRDYILTKVNVVAFSSLQNLGEKIISEVDASVAVKRDDLKDFNKNFNTVLKDNFQIYLATKNIEHLSGGVLKENNNQADFQIQNMLIRNKLSGLSKNSALSGLEILKTQFEVLEQILNLPEFSQSPVLPENLSQTGLVHLILNPSERQYLQKRTDSANQNQLIQLNDQSQVLLTTAKLIREVADWKTTGFDENLSAIKASEIITEFKTDELNRSFFAKADLLALTLSISSQTLKLLQGDYSPLILIDNNQNLLQIADFNENQSTPLALVAASDFINGKRSTTIKARDLSQFQLALIEFYSATSGLEKTTSQILRREDKDSPNLLTQILDARKKIKVLIIAIGNYLSNQLMEQSGLIMTDLTVPTNRLGGQYNLEDQVIAIEAMVRTYELTDIDVYLWSAQDIYYSMNANMYDANLKFYKPRLAGDSSAEVDANLVLRCYKSLLRLKPYLSLNSQSQMEDIFSGWLANF